MTLIVLSSSDCTKSEQIHTITQENEVNKKCQKKKKNQLK